MQKEVKTRLASGNRTIPYTLTVEPRRDLAITVHPDLRVTVRAPETKSTDLVESRIRARRAWIARQLDEFEAYHPLPVPKRFVSGETLWYLGRQYVLKVSKGRVSVRTASGRLSVSVGNPSSRVAVRRAVERWYLDRARAVFGERLGVVTSRARALRGLTPQLRVRRMKRRWGSCTKSGTITLNPELLKVPKACIDYVIAHELCHVLVPDHSARFYHLLEECMPDWRLRRARLSRSDR